MAKEIERKFLVSTDGWKSAASKVTALQQAYIASMDDRSLRVRIMNNERARLTIKIGTGTMTRDEFEYDIPLEDAFDLLPLAIGIVLEKTRYEVHHAGFVWEVDVYGGAYKGLVIAEVELSDESDAPALPGWVGREVTGDQRYSNQWLATDAAVEDVANGLSIRSL